MGLSSVMQFIRSTVEGLFVPEVQITPGAEELPVTAEHYAPPGVDAVPLAGDTAAHMRGPGSGRWVVVGYMDTANEGQAEPGELRLYSRNADGAIVASVWLKGDGSVVVNDVLTVDADGNMVIGSAADSLALNSRVLELEAAVATHTHTTTATIGLGPAVGVISPPVGFTPPGDYASDRVKVDS